MQSFLSDVRSYYHEASELMAASFENIPVVWNAFPNASEPAVWRGPLHAGPHKLPTVDVGRRDGSVRPYLALQTQTLDWLVEYHHAVEFHSWTPIPGDPQAVRYARILLEAGAAHGGPSPAAVLEAALQLKGILRERRLESIAVLDGIGGVAIFIPFSDTPAFPEVRTWLHELINDAAAKYPKLFTTEPNSAGGTRVHLHVKSNAPGLFSALPYSLRGPDCCCAVAPVTWDELASRRSDDLCVEVAELLERVRSQGDLFAQLRDAIGPQRFRAVQREATRVLLVPAEAHGRIIAAALEILGDGRARSAEDILNEGVARDLLPASTSEKYVYNALVTLIARNVARGRKAEIVQNPDRTFRLNEPLDDWPDVELPPPAHDEAAPALAARLRTTAHGDDPTAWEAAVCDAFAHLCFRATHVGGNMAPDGYVDAQVGPLGYRAMLECKSGRGVVNEPDAAEAAKWADAYHAQFCALIGPGFSQEVELVRELIAHKVSGWTVDDLVAAIEALLDPLELRACFAPGFAQDALLDILWERAHGERKRIAYITETINTQGWKAQVAAATQADPANAARLTLDAAMLLVQEELTRAGAARACTRDEIELGFEYLTNPVVRRAVWLDASRTAIVLRREPAP